MTAADLTWRKYQSIKLTTLYKNNFKLYYLSLWVAPWLYIAVGLASFYFSKSLSVPVTVSLASIFASSVFIFDRLARKRISEVLKIRISGMDWPEFRSWQIVEMRNFLWAIGIRTFEMEESLAKFFDCKQSDYAKNEVVAGALVIALLTPPWASYYSHRLSSENIFGPREAELFTTLAALGLCVLFGAWFVRMIVLDFFTFKVRDREQLAKFIREASLERRREAALQELP